MRELLGRLSTDRALILLLVALMVVSTALVALLGYYGDVMRAFWNLI